MNNILLVVIDRLGLQQTEEEKIVRYKSRFLIKSQKNRHKISI